MIVSTLRPYFAPFPGFFARAHACDVLVLLDSVQFPRSTTWLTRNRFKNHRGMLWITIPVWKGGRGLQKIRDVKICHDSNWPRKHLQSIKEAYTNAPFLDNHLDFLKSIFTEPGEYLIDLNINILYYLFDRLKITTKIIRLSELAIDTREPQLTLDICKALQASHFLTPRYVGKYLDKAAFRAAGIELLFYQYRAPVYPQLRGPFIANLSTFDLLFNCGSKATEIIFNREYDPRPSQP